MPKTEMTFWDHLDELRTVLIRVVAVVVSIAIISFLFRDEIFSIVLAPSQSDFVLYRCFEKLAIAMQMPQMIPGKLHIELISTELTSQFMIHMSVSLYMGVLITSPYILYEIYRFISPALRAGERRYSTQVVGAAYILFVCGVLLSYFLIFPLTFRFLSTYQVSLQVKNLITLGSYIDTLMALSLTMGIVFEIPILSWFFAKLGLLHSFYMRKYRRHTLVVILIIGAVITPTSDIFTLILVSLPMYLLYEASIHIVKRCERKLINASTPESPEDTWTDNPYKY